MSTRLERIWYPAAREPLATRLLLSPLWAASAGFGAAVRLREALYAHGWLSAERVEGLRVVSVGNLNVGGAGKTPAVIHLAQRLAARGEKVAVLTRGYGRAGGKPVVIPPGGAPPSEVEAGDEPLLVARRCPAAAVLVGADRAALARRARDELGATVAILDDGMQHRRLARDVEIAVVDSEAAFGNGHLLPRGPLREPASALARADLVWLRTRPNAPPPAWISDRPTVHACYAPEGVVAPDGRLLPADALRGEPVVMLCGIARPESFARTLEGMGARVEAVRAFADHHRFSPGELDEVARAARKLGAKIATTEKDAVRLPPGHPALAVRLGVRLEKGEELLDALLSRR